MVKDAKNDNGGIFGWINTIAAPWAQYVTSIGDKEHPITQVNGNMSKRYNAYNTHISRIQMRQLAREGKLPTEKGQVVNFPINPSAYREMNKALGNRPVYATFDLRNPNMWRGMFEGGMNTVEYTNGGQSGKIMIYPNDPRFFAVKHTDESAWDMTEAEKRRTSNPVRLIMAEIGSSKGKAHKQEFYQLIPRDTIFSTGKTDDFDYFGGNRVNQNELRNLFNNYTKSKKK